MKLFRAYAKRLVLANWKGIIFHAFDLDRHVTGLEGQNGAGKTTVMAAYVTAILPNQRLLSFKNINGAASAGRGDGGLWGRLGENGISYALIEWITPRGKHLWAGVALTRGAFPSIDIKPLTIHELSPDASPYQVLLPRDGNAAVVPPLPRLREHVAMHGGRLVVHKTLADYMKLLFDQGVTPMPMTTHEEQERFYRVLSTSMEGSALVTLIRTGLRDYLLSPDASLERRVSLMRESLEQCRQTRQELERAQDAHAEIDGLYDAAWKMASYAFFGARGRFEQEQKNWKERSSAYMESNRRYHGQKAKVGQLQHRLEELKRELVSARVRAEERRVDLENARRAHGLRSALERGRMEQISLQGAADRARAQCEQTSISETEAARALEHAQEEYARVAEELANTQKAVEGLIRRVTELHVARTLLADAKKAMKPAKLDRHNAASVKEQLDREYDAATHRYAAAQAEFDGFGEHLARFDALLAKLRDLASAERWREPSPGSAHEQAVALETVLRERSAQAESIEGLQGELARARDMAKEQNEVRQLAAELGIDSGATLTRQLVAVQARLDQLDSEIAAIADESAERQYALVEAKGRLPALEEEARRHAEAQSLRDRLAVSCPDWATTTTHDMLADAVVTGRQELSRVDERRRSVESGLYDADERIRSLQDYAGLLDPQLGVVAEHVEGRLLATRFDELPAQDAAAAQARLGMWTEAIVVAAPAHAARQAAELVDRPDTLLFVSEQAVHAVQDGVSLDDSELVPERLNGEGAARLSRRPVYPVLGRRARELEIVRLRATRGELEIEQANLRERSRTLNQGLGLAERLLALGPAAWVPDPRPAVVAEQANIRALAQALTSLQARSAQLRVEVTTIVRRRQRMLALESRRSLLGPPDYRDAAARLALQLEAAYSARAWIVQYAGAAREILGGLPILANVVEEGRRDRLAEELERLRNSRDRLALQREALVRLLKVVDHLDREDDERAYDERKSLIAALEKRIAPARIRMQEAGKLFETRRAEVDAARFAASAALAALLQGKERCDALSTELTETGAQGTDEELDLAQNGYDATNADAVRIACEVDEIHESYIEQRTSLASLLDKAEEQKQLTSQQLSTLRFERRTQRDLVRVVRQLGLHGRIDSEHNRQQNLPTGSQINAFQSSQTQQALLLDRLKPWPDVVSDLKHIEGLSEPSGERRAIQTLRAWQRVRRHIEQRIPRNLATADDPQIALAQMTEKMCELRHALVAQEEDMRSRSSGLADGIAARQRSARSLVTRLNRELEQVNFGSIRGLRIDLSIPDDMTKMLECLRRDKSLALFDSGDPLEDTLARLYERETGGRIQGARLFDYRNYIQLRLEVRRINGKWEATGDVSTGEAIGAGAAVLVMILRTWNEEAHRISGSAGYAMQQILLDEANRLDEQALDTLTEFCQRMDVQALVAAPGLEKPRQSTVFQLSRTMRGRDEFVVIRGTRISA